MPLDDTRFAPACYPGRLNPERRSRCRCKWGGSRRRRFRSAAGAAGAIIGTAGRFGGTSVPRAEVQVLTTSTHDSAIVANVRADGSFAVDGISAGEYRVVAVQRGARPGDVRRTDYRLSETADGEAALMLHLLDGCRVRGRWSPANGAPRPCVLPACSFVRFRSSPICRSRFAIDARTPVKDDGVVIRS